jgi:hypothetical protein
VVEGYGIPTACLSINLAASERIGAPRTLFVRFPHGAAFGEPEAVQQQRTILRDLFWLLQDCREPGSIVRAPYRWRRTRYEEVDTASFQRTPALDPHAKL